MKYINKSLFIPALLFAISSSAQNTNIEEKRALITVAPRVGVMVHNGFGVEAGVSVISLSPPEAFPWYASSVYATYFIQQKDVNSGLNVDGFKAGLQSSWGFFMGGIEVKTGSYNNSMFTYISPKVGLSFLDVVNIEYLINIAGKSENFPWRSNHQVGLNISLNRKIYNTIWKG